MKSTSKKSTAKQSDQDSRKQPSKDSRKQPSKDSRKEQKKQLKKITKNMLIGDIIKENRDAAIIMMQHGMHCVGCMVASNETLKQGCCAHGMDEKQVDEIVKSINKLKDCK
jgi:hybrid cluster-associated redox disulfide protein